MRVKQFINRKIKNKFLKRTLRAFKSICFLLVSAVGSSIFWLLRIIGLMPRVGAVDLSDVKSVLIVRMDRIGDMLLSLPAIKVIRESFPQAAVSVLTTSYTKDLLAANRDIDRVLVCDGNCDKKSLFARVGEQGFDIAFIFSPYFSSAWMAFKLGARHRIGYPVKGSGFLLTVKVPLGSRVKHESEAVMDVLAAAGVETYFPEQDYVLTQDALEFAGNFFAEQGVSPDDVLVAMHPSAFEEHTRWPFEKYAELADKLIEREGVKILFTGSSSDRGTISLLKEKMRHVPMIAPDNMTLSRLAGVLSRAKVFVGNNSGIMHLASAVGVPVVAVFGAIHPQENENRWHPLGEHQIVRVEMDCKDCHPGHCRDYGCIKDVAAEDVCNAVKKYLEAY